MHSYDSLANRIINEEQLTRDEARTLMTLTSESEIRALAAAANTVRKYFQRNSIDFCSLINARSGKCTEDCSFCAQSCHYECNVDTYTFLDEAVIVAKARAAEKAGSHRFCIVTSGAQLSDTDFTRALSAYRAIRKATSLKIDGSLGFLTEDRVQQLKAVGLSRYNHNLETSRRFYPSIVTTHSWDDRLATIRLVRKYGIETCVGGIIGLGETVDDRIDLAFSVRDEKIDCVPINILIPREGTPLGKNPRVKPLEAIAVISTFRLIHPRASIKIAGGRETALGAHQQLSLEAGGNGYIIGGYLTTMGNDPEKDKDLARRAGYEL